MCSDFAFSLDNVYITRYNRVRYDQLYLPPILALQKVSGADPERGAAGQRSGRTMEEGTAESGGQVPADRSTDRPAAALSTFGGEGDHANQGTSVGWKLPRGR